MDTEAVFNRFKQMKNRESREKHMNNGGISGVI
jgi:hypothetical protein